MKHIQSTFFLTFFILVNFAPLFSQKQLMEMVNADLIEMDKNNGDGTFQARDKETQKWGMYQFSFDNGKPTEMIPKQYDSIQYFGVNEKFTAVYNNGKLGIYTCYFDYQNNAKETVPCLYDDYKKMIIPFKGHILDAPFSYTEEYLAAKKNGKWGWVNWFTGEEQSKFIYKTTKELPVPNYEQHWQKTQDK